LYGSNKKINWAPSLFDNSLFHTSKGDVDVMDRAKEVLESSYMKRFQIFETDEPPREDLSGPSLPISGHRPVDDLPGAPL